MATQRNPRATTKGSANPSTTIRAGDRLASLEVIRNKLADLLDDADDRTAPALAQRLSTVMAEIESLSAPAKESRVGKLRDDLAAKRAQRRPATGS